MAVRRVRGLNSQDLKPVLVRPRMPAMTSTVTSCGDLKREKCVESSRGLQLNSLARRD